jgi:acetoin utilization protein AcuB
MIVARIMTRDPVTIAPTDTLRLARDRMEAGSFRRLPVVEAGKMIAILTDRDTRAHEGYLATTAVSAAMTPNPITVSPTTPVERAANAMIKRKIGGLPVIENGKLVGIVAASDLLRAFVEMLGARDEDVARVDIALDGGIDRVTAALEIAAGRCGEVRGLGSYDIEGEDHRVFFVRIPAPDARAVAASLTENGFRVLAVHF